jgi:heme/copper-type cytochrome/quinol oxidase subunit 2
MRLVILILCALIAAGVFAVMLFAIWRSHHRASPAASSRQSLAMELVWAAIPCLMIVAAAFPAVIVIAAGSAGDSRALFGKWLNAESRRREVRSAPSNVPGAPTGRLQKGGVS